MIAQGFLYRGEEQHVVREQSSGAPCRCARGHLSACAIGVRIPPDEIRSIRAISSSSWALGELVYVNDTAANVDQFRQSAAEIALKFDLDDSVCWWEVEECS